MFSFMNISEQLSLVNSTFNEFRLFFSQLPVNQRHTYEIIIDSKDDHHRNSHIRFVTFRKTIQALLRS